MSSKRPWTEKVISLRCDDKAENLVLICSEYDGERDYEVCIEDAYCGKRSDCKNRFIRAWRAFWAKPITYTGIYISDTERLKKFFEDCLDALNTPNLCEGGDGTERP